MNFDALKDPAEAILEAFIVQARIRHRIVPLFRFTLIALQVYAFGNIPAAEDGGLSKNYLSGNLCNHTWKNVEAKKKRLYIFSELILLSFRIRGCHAIGHAFP